MWSVDSKKEEHAPSLLSYALSNYLINLGHITSEWTVSDRLNVRPALTGSLLVNNCLFLGLLSTFPTESKRLALLSVSVCLSAWQNVGKRDNSQ